MNAYIESRKMVLMNFFSGLQWRWRHREQIYEHWGEGREGECEKNGKSSIETYTLPYVE